MYLVLTPLMEATEIAASYVAGEPMVAESGLEARLVFPFGEPCAEL